MDPLTIGEVLAATGGTLLAPGPNLEDRSHRVLGVSVDTRTLRPGDAFIALPGPNFDGHEFVGDAFLRGSALAIISQATEETRKLARLNATALILVDDTLGALQRLAAFYRGRHPVTSVGVTGSNGKTTTKEMTACVLATRYSVCKTAGNLNGQVGVPLTIFQLNATHQVLVAEMGMSRLGEITRLSELVRPEIGVITNISPAHLEFIGSVENIRTAKFELLGALRPGDTAIINADDPNLAGAKEATRARVISFGIVSEATVRASAPRALPDGGCTFSLLDSGVTFTVPLWGRFNAYNALAAIAVGQTLGIAPEEMRKALSAFRTAPGRMERVRLGTVELINESYNANPVSMQLSLQDLSAASGGRRIAVLGDMKELGPQSRVLHEGVGRIVQACAYDVLITVGKEARWIARGAMDAGMPEERIQSFQENASALAILRTLLRGNDRVLVKGSRAMRLEEIVDGLRSGPFPSDG
jgi:UDP-N-acetylmuramoyl-tripeptide--D-alanyl-D-alanine ligase